MKMVVIIMRNKIIVCYFIIWDTCNTKFKFRNLEKKKQVMLGAIPLIIPDAHLPVMKRAALNKDKGKKEDLNRA